MTSLELKKKQKIKFFEDGMRDDHVLLHMDSRRSGVKVPDSLAGNYSLTLKLSYLFQGKTTHDANGIVSFLKFGSDYFECIIPWASIWGITDSSGKNQVWPDDLPQELLIEYTKRAFTELTNTGKALLNKRKAKKVSKKAAEESPLPPHPEERRKLLKLIKPSTKN